MQSVDIEKCVTQTGEGKDTDAKRFIARRFKRRGKKNARFEKSRHDRERDDPSKRNCVSLIEYLPFLGFARDEIDDTIQPSQ